MAFQIYFSKKTNPKLFTRQPRKGQKEKREKERKKEKLEEKIAVEFMQHILGLNDYDNNNKAQVLFPVLGILLKKFWRKKLKQIWTKKINRIERKIWIV